MGVEIGKISLQRLTRVAVRERARIVRHAVPGLSGELAQPMGRPSVEISLCGIFYGDKAADDLGSLRKLYLDRKPVDFFADAVGNGYFTQVLIAGLEVSEQAGENDQFLFRCEVVEYVEPPEPVAASPFDGLDAGLVDEATAFMDDVQNAIDEVSRLVDLAANTPNFGDPTAKLATMPNAFVSLVTGAGPQTLGVIRNLF